MNVKFFIDPMLVFLAIFFICMYLTIHSIVNIIDLINSIRVLKKSLKNSNDDEQNQLRIRHQQKSVLPIKKSPRYI